MLISYNWLQSYFSDPLPDADSVANTLMLHAFEIEEVKKTESDTLIDIDVLPNRAHDCLSHRGVAHELAGLLSLAVNDNRYTLKTEVRPETSEKTISVNIETDNCRRYMSCVIENVNVDAPLDWVVDHLAGIGQRSINNVVDATNILMFDYGQPFHAFDADKVSGGITIRQAHEGESFVTLTDENIELTADDMVIADDEGVLALAGVKGGKKAEVTHGTKNLVLEVANFDPVAVRSSSRRHKLLTDSAKRFENEITPEMCGGAMEALRATMIETLASNNMLIGEVVDIYTQKPEQHQVSVSHDQLERLLGIDIGSSEVLTILNRFGYEYIDNDNVYTVTIPHERFDLRIAQDLVEEIGRIYGYHNIPSASVADIVSAPEVHSGFATQQRLRNILVERGFNEIMTYSFVKEGSLEMLNPIASDKKALRTSLTPGMQDSLDFNSRNADWFGVDRILLFELGRTYHAIDDEHHLLSVGIHNMNKSAKKRYGTESEQLESLTADLEKILGYSLDYRIKDNVAIFVLDQIKQVEGYSDLLVAASSYSGMMEYSPFSVYPFIRRDVSLWIDEAISQEQLMETILKNKQDYLKKVFFLDRFEKEGRVSYAFSLIFQSHERTLTDHEVNTEMQSITQALELAGGEIR